MEGMKTTSYTYDDSSRRKEPSPSGSTPAPEYGELQRLVDELYEHGPSQAVSRMDAIVRAEIDDLSDDLLEVVNLLPAGSYKRSTLCDQLNSIITAHGWAYVYGTVE
jgi:hypothetical protein